LPSVYAGHADLCSPEREAGSRVTPGGVWLRPDAGFLQIGAGTIPLRVSLTVALSRTFSDIPGFISIGIGTLKDSRGPCPSFADRKWVTRAGAGNPANSRYPILWPQPADPDARLNGWSGLALASNSRDTPTFSAP